MKKALLCLSGMLLTILICQTASAQQTHPRFWNDIQQFKHQDSIQPPPSHAILFVGSSSFRKWTDVQSYFPDFRIINRGFGGSTLPEAARYADDIIFPYNPAQIIIYEGDNDAVGKGVTADSIFNRFQRLFTLIRSRLPRTPLAYVSIKPSPSRERFMPVMDYANYKIRTFLATQPRTHFIDVYHLMLNDKGLPRPELFQSDMLHMKPEGYKIWQKAIRPVLVKKAKK
jgi:lysophospholipase L1-like esterase